jgi:hypothetical protein
MALLPNWLLLVCTTEVADERAGDELPPAFDAMTATRRVEPMSALTTVYVEVAAEIDAQLAPVASQRLH